MTLIRRTQIACIMVILTGCTAPTEVIDLQNAPEATRDAMLRIRVLPLGMPAPPDAGSIGPVSGYGCGSSSAEAASYAVQQLQAKALRMQATAIADVLFSSGGLGPCQLGNSVVASGIAVGPRGVPPTY